ncbi:AraC family transcriptional regulator [Paenibacillus sp. GD4]|uniref:helix-turn-helix transcriptional regulator n=1 Tax=Paenibacillus sp. GD4 TaxID=3068890 RepID=UPI002796959D|nr:AraC family transcriptional regulator [Paenibacillus sp. GD4]MDQ1913629.1 AraC family transcriptional regulator [Paenibacillus sp. GD4]
MFFHDLRMEKELIFERRIDSDVEHELHMHDLLEINVLLENRAEFRLLNESYAGEPGDVFIFRPYEPHYNLTVDADKPIKWIMVLFSPSIVRMIPYGYRLLYPFYTAASAPHIPAASFYAQSIQAAARAAFEEQEKRLHGWESKQMMHFIDILVHIYRYSLDCLSEKEQAEIETGVVATVAYILRHITEDIDIRELIEIYGKGKTNFYTGFKQAVGVTPNQFIHRLRMQIAMYLLKTTDKSITDIAFECGYHSIHYFNKHFKQYRNLSPREYRNRTKKAI